MHTYGIKFQISIIVQVLRVGGFMEYTGEGVQALVCALDEMQNSTLIFVDKKLKSVLKCLAYYDEFRTVLAYCNQGFDYQTEKRKSLVKIGDNSVLRLPKNPKALVALVANLLLEFDSGSMDIVSFAGDFFPAVNKQDSYSECFVSLIEPFKLALVGLVVEGIEEDVPVVERTVEFASDGLQQHTEYLLVNMVNAVREAKLDEEIRAEFLLMLEGFAAALDTRDTLMIKSIWLGLKRALAAQKLCARETEKVDEALRLYIVAK